MKRHSRLLLFLIVLAAITGYLLSKASLVGRAGITLFYQQYRFLKVWWQGGLVVLVVWMFFFFLQGWAEHKLPSKASKWVHLGAVALAVLGLYFTYQDFRHSIAHRWLGERFHLGGYLFWIGWLVISVFYLTGKRKTNESTGLSTNRDASSTSAPTSL